jgi:LacI family gluconate utilization system Gnt-I transcriptional repressor
MKMTQAFTVHDVARLAGVSPMTVSRVINTPGKVSPVTLERVKQVVAKIGYVPNAMASGLRLSKAKLVAALLPALTVPVFQETVRSLASTP